MKLEADRDSILKSHADAEAVAKQRHPDALLAVLAETRRARQDPNSADPEEGMLHQALRHVPPSLAQAAKAVLSSSEVPASLDFLPLPLLEEAAAAADEREAALSRCNERIRTEGTKNNVTELVAERDTARRAYVDAADHLAAVCSSACTEARSAAATKCLAWVSSARAGLPQKPQQIEQASTPIGTGEKTRKENQQVLIPGRNSPVRLSCMPPACYTDTASNVNGVVTFDVRSHHNPVNNDAVSPHLPQPLRNT